MSFSTTDGVKPFAASDVFMIAVAPADGSFFPLTGSQRSVANLVERATVVPGGQQRVTAIIQEAEANKAEAAK